MRPERDEIALRAMDVLLTKESILKASEIARTPWCDVVADLSYQVSDAMIKESKK